MTHVLAGSGRPSLRNYTRVDRALHPLAPGDPESPVAERRQRWSSLVEAKPVSEAPLATRYAPLLRDAVESGRPVGCWPATIFPAGYRQQVLAHCGHLDDPGETQMATAVDDSRLAANHASLLNVQGRYRTTFALYSTYATYSTTTQGTHVLYEVARAVYQLHPGHRQAVRIFERLAREAPDPAACLNGFARVVAHLVRNEGDLTCCEAWVRDGIEAGRSELANERGFDAVLGTSRVYRAAALWSTRAGDVPTARGFMAEAEALCSELADLCEDGAQHLMQVQDERLILEAASKAFVASGQQVSRRTPGAAAARLASIDPGDPYVQLVCGDVRWRLEQDDRAAEHFARAAAMGTLVGAHAAYRLALVDAWRGEDQRAQEWLERAAELDPGFVGCADDWRGR